VVRPPAFVGMKKSSSTFRSLAWSARYKSRPVFLKLNIAINLPNRLLLKPHAVFFIFINELSTAFVMFASRFVFMTHRFLSLESKNRRDNSPLRFSLSFRFYIFGVHTMTPS